MAALPAARHRAAGLVCAAGDAGRTSWPRRSSAQRSPPALVDAPVPLLGLHSGGGDHVSAGLRLDRLPLAARRPDDLRDLSVRISSGTVPAPHASSRFCCFMGSISRRFWCSRACSFRSGAGCATKARRPCRASRWISFPLILLFAISVTGLALTVSQEWLRGTAYSFLAILHAITVIAGLLYLPFGKFFHIFQRPAQLGVKLYHRPARAGAGAQSARAAASASLPPMHIDDLQDRAAAARLRLRDAGRRLCTGRIFAPPANANRFATAAPTEGAEGHRWLNRRCRSTTSRAVRTAPELHAGRRLAGRIAQSCRTGSSKRTAASAASNAASNSRSATTGHRLRALGRVSRSISGMLCPKGVKRYLQSNHPDRLLDPLHAHGSGIPQSQLGRSARFHRAAPAEIQDQYGKDSVAVFGGASLTTEKAT